ncbi:MAG: VOC family protein [Gammaproteobacteria bacterium]|nr:VOC family protein [Gammaproteobacteria bacterium]
MSDKNLEFDHIHLVSENPEQCANWYRDKLGGDIRNSYEIRNAPQINVQIGGITLLIRGKRNGESPSAPNPMKDFDDYSSHDHWGTDHFGFTFRGDLLTYCEALRGKGVEFSVEPWEFTPGNYICYVSAPDGVSIEIVEGK